MWGCKISKEAVLKGKFKIIFLKMRIFTEKERRKQYNNN